MPLHPTPRPEWLTFDCYGTLIQWDEGLQAAVAELLARKGAHALPPARLIEVYDRHEHALEQARPHHSFREVSAQGLRQALQELGLPAGPADAGLLTRRIGTMPPFADVLPALRWLKARGHRIAIVSNTDDDIIAGNVAQLGGLVDRVVTAQQAGAYKPDRRLFDHAHRLLGVGPAQVLHICASPHLDHAAARDIGFRCIWVDRGTGRRPLPDYQPDATVPDLSRLPPLFESLGW